VGRLDGEGEDWSPALTYAKAKKMKLSTLPTSGSHHDKLQETGFPFFLPGNDNETENI
jgi:hypothetical protein